MVKLPSLLNTIFSTYTLGDQIGQGGSGHVFVATDEDGAEVAIKVLDPARSSRRTRKRFENEVRFGGATRHENVVRVIDHGVSELGGSPVSFLVMPLHKGSLRDLMKVGIAPEDVLKLFDMVLKGLEAAHAQNVTHRDVKPENVLYLRSPAGELTLAVADFGIARFKQEDLYTAVETKTNERLANFQYASPEQRVRDRAVDHRSDIYSLGLLLNELFTGEIPSGTDFKTVGTVSGEFEFLDPVIDRMIKQNPDDRFASVSEIRREILVRGEQALSHEKLAQLKAVEIASVEQFDPILADPIKIVDVDWHDGVLTLSFQQEINDRWINALRNMGSYNSLMGASPDMFRFSSDSASVSVRGTSAQQVIDHFKKWLPKAHQVYKNSLERDAAAEEARQKKDLADRIRREELNSETRGGLHF